MNSSNISSPFNTSAIKFGLSMVAFNSVSEVLFVMFTSALMVFTLASNTFVIYAVRNHPPLMKLSNFWVSSLAVTDILMAAFVMPVATYFNTVGPWEMGGAMCKMWGTTATFAALCSLLNHTAIAIDRYFAITRAIEYSKLSARKMIGFVTLVWVLAFFIAVPQVAQTYAPWPDDFKDVICPLSANIFYTMFTTTIGFYLPAALVSAIYFKLFMVFRERVRARLDREVQMMKINESTKIVKSKKASSKVPPMTTSTLNDSNQNQTSETSSSVIERKRSTIQDAPLMCVRCDALIIINDLEADTKGATHTRLLCQICARPLVAARQVSECKIRSLEKKERRSALVMFITVAVFMLCWAPSGIAYSLASFIYYPSGLRCFFLWCAYFNSCCNPIVYHVFNKDFRRAFHKYILRRKRKFSRKGKREGETTSGDCGLGTAAAGASGTGSPHRNRKTESSNV